MGCSIILHWQVSCVSLNLIIFDNMKITFNMKNSLAQPAYRINKNCNKFPQMPLAKKCFIWSLKIFSPDILSLHSICDFSVWREWIHRTLKKANVLVRFEEIGMAENFPASYHVHIKAKIADLLQNCFMLNWNADKLQIFYNILFPD